MDASLKVGIITSALGLCGVIATAFFGYRSSKSKTDLEAIDKTVGILQSEVERLNRENKEIRAEILQLRSDIDVKEGMIATLKEEKQVLEKALKESEEEAVLLRSYIKQKDARIKELEEQQNG